MQDHGISWSRVMSKCRVTNSRDEEIADQIEKDLHRTGCTGFEGAKQAVLKRVLVSYARWNPSVGYCQGFNMIGAMLLQMTSGNETLTLKVLIYLIEGVLPQGYFSQGLRGLAMDMAVFREILRLRKPTLHNHLSILQNGDENPPLTDVFTMHWFLTLFIHCLPTNSVLRIWDLVLLEGSEVLLRTALVLWTAIEPRILAVSSADEFYSVMGVVTREMLECGLMDPNALVKCVVSVGPFPFPGLADLRQQQRAIIQQDTPYKSFFLAKRELDNLKRHYAAMKDRQRATTIILKGLEASRVRVPGQRSNSLFVAPTMKKQVVNLAPSKPKMRRASSGCKVLIGNNNSTNINNGNINNRSNNVVVNGALQTVVGKSSSSQKTMTWDKAAPKIRSKTFRRRRTASASSHNTDSSSDTELCDSHSSLSDSSDSEGVWSETDNRWKKPKTKKKSDSPGSVSLKSNKSNLSLCPPPKDGEKDELSKIDSHPAVIINEGGGSVPGGSSGKSVTNHNHHLHHNHHNYHQHQHQLQVDETLPPLQSPGDKNSTGDDEQASPEGNYYDMNEVGACLPGKLGGAGVAIGLGHSETTNVDDDDDLHHHHHLHGHGHGHSTPAKILDASDSQHFLEEISRLGKSDSFYENLSKRICELQFQNLRILSTCNTTIDPKSLVLPEFEKSPLPSPSNPYSPRNFENGLLSGTDDIYLADSSLKLTPNPTPKNFLSPRGSLSSISDCHIGQLSPLLPRSPLLSPTTTTTTVSVETPLPKSRRSSYSKRTLSGKSSQSLSSIDIPDICVDAPQSSTTKSGQTLQLENGIVEEEDTLSCDHFQQHQSSQVIAESVSHFMITLKKTSNSHDDFYSSTTEFETECSEKCNNDDEDPQEWRGAASVTSPETSSAESKEQSSPVRKSSAAGLTLDLSGCSNSESSPIKPFTPLKTPDFLQLSSFINPDEILVVNSVETTCSSGGQQQQADSNSNILESILVSSSKPTMSCSSPKKIGGIKSPSKQDVRSCLVSPILSPDLTETSLKSKRSPTTSPAKDMMIPPRPKNFPVSPVAPEEFLLAAYMRETKNDCGADENGDNSGEISVSKDEYHNIDDSCVSPAFPTTACPCQCQTTEEINAVIRQNIAILQRLKLKPAYDLAIAERDENSALFDEEDEEYEDIGDFDEASSSDYSTGFPELSNFKEDDSSDRDSGLPTCSSKNSLSRKDSSTSEKCGGGGSGGGKSSKSGGSGAGLKHQDSSGCSSGSTTASGGAAHHHHHHHYQHQYESNGLADVTSGSSTSASRRRHSSGGSSGGGGGGVGNGSRSVSITSSTTVRRKSLTRTSSVGNTSSGQVSSSSPGGNGKGKQGSKTKNFNPFPTARRARARTTKFGLYN
ncbi:unnamed protein product [Orchesella dallaii]